MTGTTSFFIGKIIEANVSVFPFYIWVPYDLSSPYYYWTTLFFITISCLNGGLVGVQFATFFCSAALNIQSQVAVLICRFKKSIKIIEEKINNHENNIDELKILERKLISDFVDNHLEVLKLAQMINDIFSIDMLIHYSASTILICSHGYVLSKVPLFSKEFLSSVFFCCGAVCGITKICLASNGISIAVFNINII